MKKISKIVSFLGLFGMFFVCFQLNAHAYIDPSAVSYVIQAVAAVVIALGACLTIFRHKIAAFFKKGKKQEKKEIHFNEEVEVDEEKKEES